MSGTSAGFGLTVHSLKFIQWISQIHSHSNLTFSFSEILLPNSFLYVFLEPLPPLTRWRSLINNVLTSEHPVPIHLITHFFIRTDHMGNVLADILIRILRYCSDTHAVAGFVSQPPASVSGLLRAGVQTHQSCGDRSLRFQREI